MVNFTYLFSLVFFKIVPKDFIYLTNIYITIKLIAMWFFQSVLPISEKREQQCKDEGAGPLTTTLHVQYDQRRTIVYQTELNGVRMGLSRSKALLKVQVRHRRIVAFVLGRLKFRDGSKDSDIDWTTLTCGVEYLNHRNSLNGRSLSIRDCCKDFTRDLVLQLRQYIKSYEPILKSNKRLEYVD